MRTLRWLPAGSGRTVAGVHLAAGLLLLAGCAGPVQPGDSGGDVPPATEAFEQRARLVADAYRQAVAGNRAWTEGYVPVQEQTLPIGDPGFDPDTRQAYENGWYRRQIDLPTRGPEQGVIKFPDGATLTVPLVSAAEAYQRLDQGDPPPCAHRPATPPPAGPDPADPPSSGPADPNGSVGAPNLAACVPLTVTAVRPGAATVWTSRGAAQVPAWLFTVAELTAPIARLAVAPSATGAVPEFAVPGPAPAPNLVATQGLTASDEERLSYTLGVGACDTEIEPLAHTDDDVVVIGGAVRRPSGECTNQLLLKPVTVTLDAPRGTRPVLDAVTGRVLLLGVR